MIKWTEVYEPGSASGIETCMYDHCFGITPAGNYLITWKGWKNYPFYYIDKSPFIGSNDYRSFDTLKAAKDAAESHFEEVIQECLNQTK